MKSFLIFFLLVYCISINSQTKPLISFNEPEYVNIFNGVNYDKWNIKECSPDSLLVSSTLYSKNNIYQASNLIDNNLNTAWVEGDKDDGIGEKIIIHFDLFSCQPAILKIVPGYAKDSSTWYKNNRVSEINIKLLKINEAGNINQTIPFLETSCQLLTDTNLTIPNKAQYISFEPWLSQNAEFGDFVAIEIEIANIDNTHAKFNDTCISEIAVYTYY